MIQALFGVERQALPLNGMVAVPPECSNSQSVCCPSFSRSLSRRVEKWVSHPGKTPHNQTPLLYVRFHVDVATPMDLVIHREAASKQRIVLPLHQDAWSSGSGKETAGEEGRRTDHKSLRRLQSEIQGA